MEQEYPERYSESSPEPYKYGRSESEMLIDRLDKLTIALERQQENNERLMSMIERQMTVIERLLLR